eukprot:gene26329-17424_t
MGLGTCTDPGSTPDQPDLPKPELKFDAGYLPAGAYYSDGPSSESFVDFQVRILQKEAVIIRKQITATM